MKIISIINTKGGVGKTVTTVHLGAALAASGRRVLLLDVDLQAGLSNYFSLDHDGATMSDVLLSGVPLDLAAREVGPGLFIVPATANMERAEVELTSLSGGEVRLKRAFQIWRGTPFSREVPDPSFPKLPDWVLIDCPSGWGAVTRNAVIASDAILVPVNSEPASLPTAISTIEAARQLNELHDRNGELLGVLLTRHRATNAAQSVERATQSEWGEKVFQTRIRQAEKINELFIRGQTSGAGAKTHPVHQDYENLAREVIRRGEKR